MCTNLSGYYCCGCLVTKLCLSLCGPVDCSLQGSSVHGILQARILEWVAVSFSRGSSWPRYRTQVCSLADSLPLSHEGSPQWRLVIPLFKCSVPKSDSVTLWTAAPRLPCPSLPPSVCSLSHPLSQWHHPTISLCVAPFSCPQSFPASRSFLIWCEVSSSHQVARLLDLQLQHQSFQWIFRVDFLEDWLVWSRCPFICLVL